MTVSIPSSGGFELAILDSTGKSQGTLAAGTGGDQVTSQNSINYVSDSTSGTSWTFKWTPPTSNVGSVVLYVAGGTHNTSYLNSYTIAAPSGGPPALPTLNLSSTGLTFSAAVGGTATSQNVQVTASDGSAIAFNAAGAVTTPSGGSWLSLGSASTTPATESVSVNLTGLAAGTYNGNVTFTSSAVSNSPVTLPVTLTVGSTTPPPTGQTFSLVVVDRQSGGSDWLLLDGSGSVSSNNTVTGSGNFTRFRSGLRETEGSPGGPTSLIVAGGTWKTTGLTSSASGKLVLQVQLTAATSSSSTLSTGTLTITSTSGSSGDAILAIDQGSTFNSAGIGRASLTGGGGGNTGGGSGGGDDGVTDH